MSLTVKKRRRSTSPRGDYITKCDYCGVCWPRHLLRKDASGLLYCQDEGNGLDELTLSRGNAVNARTQLRTPPRDAGSGCVSDAFAETTYRCDLDDSAIELVSFLPPDGFVGAAKTTRLFLTFNKNVVKGTGNIYVVRQSDNVIVETIDVLSDAVTISPGGEVEVVRSVVLDDATTYYINIDEGAFSDCNLQTWPGIQNTTTWNFTTTDTTNPELVTSDPPDGATDICYNVNITLTFNEEVQAGAGNILLRRFSDDAIFQTFDVTNPADVEFDFVNVTLLVSGDMDDNTQYYVEMGVGVVEDLFGNSYGGLTKGELDFTTVDRTPVELTTPGDTTLAVPSWATSAQVKMRGGGGGAGGSGDDEIGGSGGGASAVDANLSMEGIATLAFRIGGGGSGGSGAGSDNSGGGGGGGGGLSGVFASSIGEATRLAIAQGAGGGGGGDQSGGGGVGADGAPGGTSIGMDGDDAGAAQGGFAGTQATGGAGGAGDNSGSAGALFAGGDGADGVQSGSPRGPNAGGPGGTGGGGTGGIGLGLSGGGGGGGAGFYGGGGAASSSGGGVNTGAGGGSGSGSVTNASSTLYAGSGVQPGLNGDTDLGSSGTGGLPGILGADGADGQNGMAWVQFGCEVIE